jgi:hypothetical protein
MFFSHSFSFFLLNFPFVFHIALGSYQNFADVILTVAFNLLHPCTDVLERLFVIDGISKDNTRGSFEVGLSYVSESLLTSSIPYL